MLTKLMKWISIGVLLPTIFWQTSAGYHVALQLLVCTGALAVAWEGYRSGKQVWAIAFAAIAAVFNPFRPLSFSRGMLLWLSLVSVAMFLASLVVLKTKPRAAMPSIAS